MAAPAGVSGCRICAVRRWPDRLRRPQNGSGGSAAEESSLLIITDLAKQIARSSLLIFLFAACAVGADLRSETVAAFDRYVQVSEQRMAEGDSFLWIDAQRPEKREQFYARLRNGEIVTERLETLESGKSITVPSGLVHHWMGTIFIPGATLAQTLTFLQDYDNQYKFYGPDVERSRLLKRTGNHFHVFLRLRKTKVVTVIFNTEYDVDYTTLDATHAASRSYSTRITEVENAGHSDEQEKPVGHDEGFLWRLNSYWRFQQRDGGTYIQLEAISLTRDIPAGLGWLIRPFITSIPQQSLVFTLSHTRDGVSGRFVASPGYR